MLAAIPYTTFPDLPLGFNTFGLMVALGVLIGAWIGAVYGERAGIDRDETYRMAMYMVLAGIIGSRLTWVITHWSEIDGPVDVIAIWEGGIQFAGGFIAGLAVGVPMMLRWTRLQRWNVLNGYAMGLTIGVAIGRIGCYSVGEHFGRETGFFLGTRYEGGDVREPELGDVPLQEGMVFHNTSLYEMIHLVLLFALMGLVFLWVRRAGKEVQPSLFVGLFFVWYGVLRFLTDTLRVNDERVLMMTGAQWMSLAMVPFGLYVLFVIRPGLVRLAGEAKPEVGTAAGLLADDEDEDDEVADKVAVPDEVEPPEDGDDGSDDDPSGEVTEPTAEGDEATDADPESDDVEGDDAPEDDAEEKDVKTS